MFQALNQADKFDGVGGLGLGEWPGSERECLDGGEGAAGDSRGREYEERQLANQHPLFESGRTGVA